MTKSYNDAIQASLEDFASVNHDSDFVPVDNLRQFGRWAIPLIPIFLLILPRPVAFRSDNPLLAYAALVRFIYLSTLCLHLSFS